MRLVSGKRAAALVNQLSDRGTELSGLTPAVRRIVQSVRLGGDRSLRRYAERWDGLQPKQPLRVPDVELDESWKSLDPQLRRSVAHAAGNIRRFCAWQKPVEWQRARAGISLGQLVRPLESVGCYIPGGRYPLVSTLLMTAIPAQVAGVKNIRIVTPRPSHPVLGAAALLGIREIYQVGGAHAIAALAYGTESIPRVDKIVGPGNAYVTTAKKLVAFNCAIDFLAGPTEALILSESGKAEFIAADLVAQAEHDPEALCVFITNSCMLARAVAAEAVRQVKRNAIAREALQRRGAVLVAESRQQARYWANDIAPEHITIEPEDLPFIRNAGSIFVGDYSAQAAGDYASGPNHVLPTSGQARFRGGLSIMDFMKLITVQNLSSRGLQQIADTVECLASAEGLQAHAESIRARSTHA